MEEENSVMLAELESIESPEVEDRKANKIRINRGFKSAISIDEDGEKQFLANVGDTILIEYRADFWRDDTYYIVEKIDIESGDIWLHNIRIHNSGATNFKQAEDHGHYIWIPPNGRMPGFKKIRKQHKPKKK